MEGPEQFHHDLMPYGSHGEKRYIKVQKSFSLNTSTLIQMNCSYVGMMNVRTRSKLVLWRPSHV